MEQKILDNLDSIISESKHIQTAFRISRQTNDISSTHQIKWGFDQNRKFCYRRKSNLLKLWESLHNMI